METANRTENELLQEALAVQDACNLSGVAQAFARAMHDLHNLSWKNNHGTEWKNKHIVSKLWASKIMSLTGDLPLEIPKAL